MKQRYTVACPGGLSALQASAPLHGHQGAVHGGHELFHALVDGKGAALADGDGAPRLEHAPFHAKALALGRPRAAVDVLAQVLAPGVAPEPA